MARAPHPPYPPFPPFPPYPPYPPYPAPQVHIISCGCGRCGTSPSHLARTGAIGTCGPSDGPVGNGRPGSGGGGQSNANGDAPTSGTGKPTPGPGSDGNDGNSKPRDTPARTYPPLSAVSKFRDSIIVEIHPGQNAQATDPIVVELARGSAVNRWIGLNLAPDRFLGDFMEAWPGQPLPPSRTFSVADMPRKIGLWREFPLVIHLVAGEVAIPDPSVYAGCRIVFNWQSAP